jgi:hypothetical protein
LKQQSAGLDRAADRSGLVSLECRELVCRIKGRVPQ